MYSGWEKWCVLINGGHLLVLSSWKDKPSWEQTGKVWVGNIHREQTLRDEKWSSLEDDPRPCVGSPETRVWEHLENVSNCETLCEETDKDIVRERVSSTDPSDNDSGFDSKCKWKKLRVLSRTWGFLLFCFGFLLIPSPFSSSLLNPPSLIGVSLFSVFLSLFPFDLFIFH